MIRTLVKTDVVEVGERVLSIRYFADRTARGLPRYSAEIELGADDRVILDDDSLARLEARAARLAPATCYSRLLVKATAA